MLQLLPRQQRPQQLQLAVVDGPDAPTAGDLRRQGQCRHLEHSSAER
jgi:hypothetical protein